MKIYQCDSCKKVIENPYEAEMKEFYVGCEFDSMGIMPVNSKKKTTVHLCEECFKGLNLIAKNIKSNIEQGVDVMGEQMNFPNTFKEFAELYKTVDTKEVYSNGIEFLPIFRVEQWLEYISAVEMATFESTINSLQEQNEKYKTEIMRLEHNERVLSKNSIIAQYPHHWLLDKGWFLSKEPDGYGKFKAQVSNEAYKKCIEKAKSELKNISKFDFHGTDYYLVGEAFFDNLLKEICGSEV